MAGFKHSNKFREGVKIGFRVDVSAREENQYHQVGIFSFDFGIFL